MSRNLSLNFSQAFDGKIWNMLPNQTGSKMVLEIRNDEQMTLSFFIYDFYSNKIQGPITLDEKWWASTAHISNRVVVFKNYDSDANAKILSYEAYDLDSLKRVWFKDDMNKVSFGLNTFSTTSNEGNFMLFNLSSGELIN